MTSNEVPQTSSEVPPQTSLKGLRLSTDICDIPSVIVLNSTGWVIRLVPFLAWTAEVHPPHKPCNPMLRCPVAEGGGTTGGGGTTSRAPPVQSKMAQQHARGQGWLGRAAWWPAAAAARRGGGGTGATAHATTAVCGFSNRPDAPLGGRSCRAEQHHRGRGSWGAQQPPRRDAPRCSSADQLPELQPAPAARSCRAVGPAVARPTARLACN